MKDNPAFEQAITPSTTYLLLRLHQPQDLRPLDLQPLDHQHLDPQHLDPQHRGSHSLRHGEIWMVAVRIISILAHSN